MRAPVSRFAWVALWMVGCSARATVTPDGGGVDARFLVDSPAVPDAQVDGWAPECAPGTTFCRGGEVTTCDADGRITGMTPCPAATVCAGAGECVDPCDALAIGATYEGCVFVGSAPPSRLSGHGGPRLPELGFGLHNATTDEATVDITGGTLAAPVSTTIAGASSAFVTVPFIGGVFDRAVYGVSPTVLARDTASYRIEADRPIVAYQFSPEVGIVLDESTFLMKADATVLFPTHVWGTEYGVATMAPICWSPPCTSVTDMTFVQIIAATDGTEVEVAVTAPTEPSVEGVVSSSEVTEEPIGAIVPGTPAHVTLDAGDLLQLASSGDLTGTRITSSQPVQVISGNVGVQFPGELDPLGDGHCHESILPLDSWGRSYVAVPPPHPTRPEALTHYVRLVAGDAPAHVTFDPSTTAPIDLAAGEHRDLDPVPGPTRVTSDAPILVLGMSTPSDVPTGDFLDQPYGASSMVAYPPFEQWRTEYGFSVPTEFDYAHAIVVYRAGASVTIDGVAVTGGAAIGATGLLYVTVPVDRTTPAHHATGSDAFVILVYGQAAGSSYWYAAGLDAATLI